MIPPGMQLLNRVFTGSKAWGGQRPGRGGTLVRRGVRGGDGWPKHVAWGWQHQEAYGTHLTCSAGVGRLSARSTHVVVVQAFKGTAGSGHPGSAFAAGRRG